MTRIVLAQTPASATFAKGLRQELYTKGYTLQEHPSANDRSISSHIEQAIVGCAAIVLLWESSAATPEWEALYIGTAQRFQKPLFPLLLDDTPLPDSIATLPNLSGQLSVSPTIAALLSLPGFPPSRSTDPLLLLQEEATNTHKIAIRRAAISKAAIMLEQDQNRDAILLLLTYLAEYEQTTILKKEARKALLADAQQRVPTPPFSAVEAPMMVGGQCEQGHISYYNRRFLCQHYRVVAYESMAPRTQQDELIAPCRHEGCSLQVVVHVDCGAFR